MGVHWILFFFSGYNLNTPKSQKMLPLKVKKYCWTSDERHFALSKGWHPAFWASLWKNHSFWPCTSHDMYNSKFCVLTVSSKHATGDWLWYVVVLDWWLCGDSSVQFSAVEQRHLSKVVPKHIIYIQKLLLKWFTSLTYVEWDMFYFSHFYNLKKPKMLPLSLWRFDSDVISQDPFLLFS